MYVLQKNAEDRIISAKFSLLPEPGEICIEQLPDGEIDDYKFLNGKLVLDPRKDRPAFNPNAPTEMQILKGIVSALAMVTGHAEVLKNGKF